MKKRRKMSKKYSKKNFTKNAVKTNWRNLADRPMRGGIRM